MHLISDAKDHANEVIRKYAEMNAQLLVFKIWNLKMFVKRYQIN